jgi:hypothetical protein
LDHALGSQDHSLGRGRRGYVFRIAITNSRIAGFDGQTVLFRYKHRKSSRWRISRIDGLEFMRRFLQHVLPKGLKEVVGRPRAARRVP